MSAFAERSVNYYWDQAWTLMWRLIGIAHRAEFDETTDRLSRRWALSEIAHVVSMLELESNELRYWRDQLATASRRAA